MNIACFFFGHVWIYARGYSTNRPMRQCRRCPKQEFTDGRE